MSSVLVSETTWPILQEVVLGDRLLCGNCGKPGYYLRTGAHYHLSDGKVECLHCLLWRQKKDRISASIAPAPDASDDDGGGDASTTP